MHWSQLALLVIEAALSMVSLGPGKFSADLSAKITKGMSKEQVVAVIGCQPGNYATFVTEIPQPAPTVVLAFTWWEDNRSAIGVLFDKHGKVASVRHELRTPIRPKGRPNPKLTNKQ